MPELPEVETLRLGLVDAGLQGQRLERVEVQRGDLRWPLDADFAQALRGRTLAGLHRRGKYLLFDLSDAQGPFWLLMHLGMTGSLVFDRGSNRTDHIHLRLWFGQRCLCFRDPRRFGSAHLHRGDPASHPLLRDMGPEPLDEHADPDHLWRASRGRRVAVKQFLMDGRVIAGVGNIYANEALWEAGIRPARPAGKVARPRFRRLAEAVRGVMREALAAGGSSISDYLHADGGGGWFQLRLRAYGREGQPCKRCGGVLRGLVLGQRSTVFCPQCQT